MQINGFEEVIPLTSMIEVELATEYGDGTAFKLGDVVRHDFRRGLYFKLAYQHQPFCNSLKPSVEQLPCSCLS
jgi:hypothetical protein